MLRSKLHEKELADESGQSYAHLGASPELPDPLGTTPKPRPDDEKEDPVPPDMPEEDDDADEENPAPDDGEGTTSADEENPNREPPPRVASGEGSPGEDAVAEAQRRDYAKDLPRWTTTLGS